MSKQITVSKLVEARLDELGAGSIPDSARDLLVSDVVEMVERLIARNVTAPRVGRAVAKALGAPLGNQAQGLKGGTPLTSSSPSDSREGA